MRRGLRNSDQKPSRNRSSAERLGARRRERLITRSCCFMSRLSATTALAPPGPRSLAIVVNRCARSTSRFFMAEQGREGCFQEPACLSCRFQVIISNSPRTGIICSVQPWHFLRWSTAREFLHCLAGETKPISTRIYIRRLVLHHMNYANNWVQTCTDGQQP